METITEIASRVASGEVTAVDVVTDALERIDSSELNAFTSVDALAIDRARAIDEAAASGAEMGPLAGVPIAVKDLIDHEGRVNTRGSSLPRDPATTTAALHPASRSRRCCRHRPHRASTSTPSGSPARTSGSARCTTRGTSSSPPADRQAARRRPWRPGSHP